MSLTRCPECNREISDKAVSCPGCGYPMTAPTRTKPRVRNGKPLKLPNGEGCIYKLSGKRRKPFAVRKTSGWIIDPDTGRSKQTFINLGTYATRAEAMQALATFNANPYDLDISITVAELYDKWTAVYFNGKEASSQRTITSAWAYCQSVYDMRVRDLRARHIKGCIEEGYRIETKGRHKGEKVFPSAHTKSRIKSLFNLMLDYALEYELADKNYARTFELSDDIVKEQEATSRGHIIFTEEELATLWANVDNVRFVDWILIQCYMGWRPQELANLRLDEVNLEDQYMKAGMKTAAGKQRIVPIHPRIKALVQRNYEQAITLGSQYLFNDPLAVKGGMTMTYDKYANRFSSVIDQLHLNKDHRPHDPRMTFITKCKRAGIDEGALKRMVGHSIKDITESVYTVRDLEWLRGDLEKIA